MRGCIHNIERLIKHDATNATVVEIAPGILQRKLQHVAGDYVRFVCPHGCPDIVVGVGRSYGGDE